jgi:DNA repair exonuclease SbcCD ATPase subunit
MSKRPNFSVPIDLDDAALNKVLGEGMIASIDNLTKQIEEQKTQIQQLTEKSEKSEKQEKQCKDELVQLQTQLVQVNTQIEQLKNESTQDKEKLQKLETEKKVLEENIKKKEEEYEKLSKENTTLQEQLTLYKEYFKEFPYEVTEIIFSLWFMRKDKIEMYSRMMKRLTDENKNTIKEIIERLEEAVKTLIENKSVSWLNPRILISMLYVKYLFSNEDNSSKNPTDLDDVIINEFVQKYKPERTIYTIKGRRSDPLSEKYIQALKTKNKDLQNLTTEEIKNKILNATNDNFLNNNPNNSDLIRRLQEIGKKYQLVSELTSETILIEFPNFDEYEDFKIRLSNIS